MITLTSSLLRLLRRHPRASLVLGLAVSAWLVVATGGDPPHLIGPPGRPLGGVAAATTSQAGTDQTPATQLPASGLKLLHSKVQLTDVSGDHGGAPQMSAATGIAIDVDTGSILWEKDAHRARAPASTVKIVSSLVALENFPADMEVGVTRDALDQASDETVMGIQAGDHYTVTELLEGMLMVSANDAATAMAVDTVGMTRFVRAMNEQAAALGLHDSHFTTPVGLDDTQQYASAYDLAVAGLVTYNSFPLFRQIVASRDLDVPATSGHIAYHIHNISRILAAYPPAMGIKPGYTGNAGYCLVAIAERDGHRVLTVVLDDGRMVDDTQRLMEWSFGQEGLPPLPTPTPAVTPPPHR